MSLAVHLYSLIIQVFIAKQIFKVCINLVFFHFPAVYRSKEKVLYFCADQYMIGNLPACFRHLYFSDDSHVLISIVITLQNE